MDAAPNVLMPLLIYISFVLWLLVYAFVLILGLNPGAIPSGPMAAIRFIRDKAKNTWNVDNCGACHVHVKYQTIIIIWDYHDSCSVIGLIKVFDAILTGRQSGQKLQCLCGNPIANNFFQNWTLHNFWIATLCISQLKPRPPEPRDIAGNLTFTQC